jgi:hypothetical protein
MTAKLDRTHWLERSTGREGHWNQPAWPARLAQSDSDTEQEGEEEHQEHRGQLRRRTARRHDTAPSQSGVNRNSSTLTSLNEASSNQKHIDSDTHREGIIGRHHRAKSTPEPCNDLHIDTILPLQMPPPNPCTSWWTEQQDSLRRSDSTASFLSGHSDGSWHGDQGDEDPNGQLERAISQLSLSTASSTINSNSASSSNSLGKQKADDGLVVSTYDYDDDDDDCFVRQTGSVDTEADVDEKEEEAIRSHAGLLMNNFASLFLDGKMITSSSLYDNKRAPDSKSSTSSTAPTYPAVLARSISNRALYSIVSSLDELTLESDMIQRQRRQRAALVTSQSALQDQEEIASPNRLRLIWQWFMPDIDDQMQKELFGSHHPATRPRLNSIPSLYSDTSETETEGDSDGESPVTARLLQDRDQISIEQSPLYAYSPKGKHSLASRNYKRSSTHSLIDTSGAPSPLWDNRYEEQPYSRSWSSMLNLTSL